jgi:hypothetical protein
MKRRIFHIVSRIMVMFIFVLVGCVLIGCDDDDQIVYIYKDVPSPVPQGVYSVTGDGEIYLYWLPIDDVNSDFAFYAVYRSDHHPDTGYWEIGTTINEYFLDNDVINGHTYYYAVSSVDVDGNLSDLSYEYVPDTPRPEGFNQIIYDFDTSPDFSGWDLDGQRLVNWEDGDSDFYLEYFPGDDVFYFNVGNEMTDIQDMGYTGDFDEIDYSPPADSGWSQNGWCEVILDHTYVIWTDDNHFAKVRIKAIGQESVIFDWGYQVDPGNRELKRYPDRPPGYLRNAGEAIQIEKSAV